MPKRLTPPTPAQLRAVYPEFTAQVANDESIAEAGATAVLLTALSDRLVIAAAAHLLALRDLRTGKADGGAGEVSLDTTGPKTQQFVTMAGEGSRDDSWWATTVYGREYLMLRNQNPRRIMSMRSF